MIKAKWAFVCLAGIALFSFPICRSDTLVSAGGAVEPPAGKERIEALLRDMERCMDSDPAKAIALGREALNMPATDRGVVTEAGILENLCLLSQKTGEHQDAIDYGRQGLRLLTVLADRTRTLNLYRRIALSQIRLARYDEALQTYTAARQLATEAGDRKAQAAFLLNIGTVYFSQGKLDAAMAAYVEAMNVFEEINDKKGRAIGLLNIALVQCEMEDYAPALDTLQKSLLMAREIKDEGLEADLLVRAGAVLYNMKKYREALSRYLAALKIFEERGDQNNLGLVLDNIGICYIDLCDYPVAMEYERRAMAILVKTQHQWGIAHALYGQGRALARMGRPVPALRRLAEAMKRARQINQIGLIRDIHQELADVFAAAGNYRAALENFKEFKARNDELLNESKIRKIKDLQLKYEVAKNEREINAWKSAERIRNAEMEKQKLLRNGALLTCLLVFGLALLAYNRYRLKARANRQLQSANEEIRRKSEALEAVHKSMLELARKAGMAEIAGAFIHHSGNILNSIKISAQLLRERIAQSRIVKLRSVFSLMEEHRLDLGEFLALDEKGKLLPLYIKKAGDSLAEERLELMEEVRQLEEGIDGIEGILREQQVYSGAGDWNDRNSHNDSLSHNSH